MRWSRGAALPAGVLVVTVLLMVVGLTVGFESFNGKGFVARIVIYPVLMLAVPLAWWWRHRGRGVEPPWGAFALVMTPFLVDVLGNFLDLYDRIEAWDDLNHLVNWFLLLWGIGLLVFPTRESVARPGLTVLTVAGVGALLAVLWEVGEWYVFLKAGVESDGLYQDTIGDEVLGTAGAALAGLVVLRRRRRGAPVRVPGDPSSPTT
ncbi:hypothetical protein [Phycicoccus sonneratiae]|uniref:DUF2238 domain-containing protein n=1 Tax=Phycicoccus sonneratiae TaxID=2807628 RepID=A0ABS2CJC6_9MICO|nr:hypothetical protein [Phycicoccus sonneraticus]MBM6399977.1 hypothetical protein [Phycicoccus sonneraticus]